ncbi:MAG: amylo-alpha-1,6-glucosidase [Acidobacteria bacterium]|nr:amylo-alpha-1,6-glucosidase [Acidobacteriota bacterium]
MGGFASGTVRLPRTRRYHALLLAATHPPAGRFVLVNGFDAVAETPSGRFPISEQTYPGAVSFPEGSRRVESFRTDPWPRWTFALEDGTRIEQEVFASRLTRATVLRWRVVSGAGPVSLEVRPFLSGRDYHSLHHENPGFRFEPEAIGDAVRFRPYEGVPEISIQSNGEYSHEPLWYRDFLYAEERSRGLDFQEDLASPGVFRFPLSKSDGAMILEANADERAPSLSGAVRRADALAAAEERRRRAFSSPLERAADDYIVRRGEGKTVVAGYPWFLDWGRDTFISLRGLCLSTGRLADARAILLEWAGAVSEGMLPNRFPERGEEPEYNAVDASLWYVVAVYEYLAAAKRLARRISAADREALQDATDRILEGYTAGTRYGIRADGDGLLACGAPGIQLTWMDAKVGDRVVTPRAGKPVEVQALWINALRLAGTRTSRWKALADRAAGAFPERFWKEDTGSLYDVVDCDGVAGTADPSFRPNQIFAVGGLPFPLLTGARARRLVDAVEERLWTPLGLRSLAPGEPGYAGRYAGGVLDRDGAYHQGTVWPWLIGPFVEAWLRVRGGGPDVRRDAEERFLVPLRAHLQTAGLGHISEVADGDAPHRPGGCPFQAWSLAEALRLELDVLAGGRRSAGSRANPDREPASSL